MNFEKNMSKIYLLLGSNVGDKKANLKDAISLIHKQIGKIIQQSSVYETEPWGFEDVSFFLNQVLMVDSSLQPAEALSEILQMEKKLGRERTEKQYASRIIDIDILFYDDLIIQTENLIIPHPLMEKRRFVLTPLNEIAGDFIHPVLQKTIKILLAECEDKLKVKRIS